MFKLLLVVLLMGMTAAAAELEDVPARMAVVHERMAVRKLYDRSLDKATAARWLADQAVTAETSLCRYAMLDEARRLAVEVRDIELVLQIINTTGKYFRINVTAEKLDALGKQRIKTIAELRGLLVRVTALADAADKVNDYETVNAALKTARTMAYRMQDSELAGKLATRAARTAVLAREWAKIKGSDANLQLGLFYCLFRKEWPRGLRLMAKGAERLPAPELVLTTGVDCTLPTDQDERTPEMAKIARVDLQDPKDPATRTQLGDSWVAISKLYTGKARGFLLTRAGRWYAKAIAASEGASRLVLERRVARTAGIGWYGVPGGGLEAHHIFGRWCRSTAKQLWSRSPKPGERQPAPYTLPLAYVFANHTDSRYEGNALVTINPDDHRSFAPRHSGGWVLDVVTQELHLTYLNKINPTVPAKGNITKVFSVGLKGGKLFLYNCRKDGVETGETALEYGKLPPINLAR